MNVGSLAWGFCWLRTVLPMRKEKNESPSPWKSVQGRSAYFQVQALDSKAFYSPFSQFLHDHCLLSPLAEPYFLC